jgi:hypothetical protein
MWQFVILVIWILVGISVNKLVTLNRSGETLQDGCSLLSVLSYKIIS